MLGYFRFILAVTVMVGHTSFKVLGWEPAPFALVGFYILSGYVMTALIKRYYARLSSLPKYYLDRLLRISPQYFFFLLLAGFAVSVFKFNDPFVGNAPTAKTVLYNLTIIPLNYLQWNDAKGFILIPPAWSLGLELQFYAIIPLLLIWRLRNKAAVLSMIVFAMAILGYLDPDLFGARLLPGVLFLFLMGSYLLDYHAGDRTAGRWACVLIGFIVAMLFLSRIIGTFDAAFNKEFMVGALMGMAVIALVGRTKPIFGDQTVGGISYGVFLCHYLMIWILTANGAWSNKAAYGATLFASSLVLGSFGYFVIERPVIAFRRRFRTAHRASLPSVEVAAVKS